MIFTIGNLITLGVVLCFLILYRLMDKNNRSMDKVKKYAEKCKEDIAAYAEEKSMAVKNFGIDLDVEKKAAAELMKNLQRLTEEELAKKAEAVARIDEQIHAYDSSLEELLGMTDRVQENLSRIKEESIFVEETGRKVGEAKDKLEQIEKALNKAKKDLEETESRLEKKNTETLEQTARELISAAQSRVSDFEAAAEVIERKVEDHREAIDKLEREREANLNRDMDTVNRLLKEAVANAGNSAEKLEDESLVKLREQAGERISLLKAQFEEKIQSAEYAAQTELETIQDSLKTIRGEWNAAAMDIEAGQKNYREEWIKEAGELKSAAMHQREEISAALAQQQETVNAALVRERDSMSAAMVQQQSEWKNDFKEFGALVEKQRTEIDSNLNQQQQKFNEALTVLNGERTELNDSLAELRVKSSEALKRQHEELNTALTELKTRYAAAAKQQQQEFSAALSKLNASLAELQTDSQNAIAQQFENLNRAAGGLKTQTAEAVKQQQDELVSITGGLKTQTAAAVKQQQEELTAVLGRLKTQTDAATKQQQEELAAVLGGLKTQTDAAAKQQQEELAAVLGGLKAQTAAAAKQQQDEQKTVLDELKEKTDAAARQHLEELTSALSGLKEQSAAAVKQQHDGIESAMAKQQEAWKTLCKDTEQGIIAATEKRLEQYSGIQGETFKQLNTLADDAARLENELRLSMQEAVSRVQKDLSEFERQSGAAVEAAAAGFNAQAKALRKELEEMDNELNSIKQQAFDNVSEKLTAFQDGFNVDLGKRGAEIGRQITDWQTDLERKLNEGAGEYTRELQLTEERIAADQRKSIASLGERLTTGLDRLKDEASAFERSIREQMSQADETRLSFAEQIKQDLTEIRGTAENEVKLQIGEHHISLQETLRQKQRELDEHLKELADRSEAMHTALDNAALNTRQSLDEWQSQNNTRMRETEASLEELRRRSREAAADNDERAAQFRLGLEDIHKELGAQKKIFDHTGVLKQELERRMEEIKGDLDRLDQRKNEITRVESQFTHIKRLEDEVNAKMTRFLSEQHRIELMEKDFNRLLKTSQAVEEKLTQVSTSDDILQAVQVQIRKLEDSIRETEEKYQRIERKKEILDETNEGIERNFKALQDTEAAVQNADEVISVLSAQFDEIRSSIEVLAAENEKAQDAAAKISVLDDSIAHIEKRIAEMNVARQWLARTETELQSLDKDIRALLNQNKTMIERESGKAAAGKGAPPPQFRDDVKRLKHRGWTVDEIANSLRLSKSEVELILEIDSRN